MRSRTPLLAIYDVPRIGHVHLIYRAQLVRPDLQPGAESRSARLFPWDDIPWSELAFPSVLWSLRRFDEVRGSIAFQPAGKPTGDEEGWKALRR